MVILRCERQSSTVAVTLPPVLRMRSSNLPRVILKPRRAAPFFNRHPWVFAGAVERVDGEAQSGDVVDVVLETSHDSDDASHRDLFREHIDMPVLQSHFCDYEEIKRAQALGDYQALVEKGRRVLRVHLRGDRERVLRHLSESVQSIVTREVTNVR